MRTYFGDAVAAKKFFMIFGKLAQTDSDYLIWEVSGNFTDQISSMIGDVIGKFIHLYSLDLNISGTFTE